MSTEQSPPYYNPGIYPEPVIPGYTGPPQYPVGPGTIVPNAYQPPSYPQCPPRGYIPFQPVPVGYPPHNTNYPGNNVFYPPPPSNIPVSTLPPANPQIIGFNTEQLRYAQPNGISSHPTPINSIPTPSTGTAFNVPIEIRRSSTRESTPIGFEIDHPEGQLYPSINHTEKTTPKTTPLPPNLVTLWQTSSPANIYFVQSEGHVVSPREQLTFTVYKCPTTANGSGILSPGSLSGFANGATSLATVGRVWRLGLKRDRSFVVKGMFGEYAFYDQSTNPARCVVITLPKSITKEEKQRLNVLLAGSAAVIDEPTNVVDKFEGGLESAYDYVTDGMDSFVKKGTPTIHKNTKWLRKGTGSLIKFSGGIVSKGMHLVSDNVLESQPPPATFVEHKQLIEVLQTTRRAIADKTVTVIESL